MTQPAQDHEALRTMLSADRLAVLGASADPHRPAGFVPAFMQSRGKQIVPVNPKHQRVLGEACYPNLASIPDPPAYVVVFRRAVFCPDVVQQAIAAGLRGVWLQSGIVSAEARQLASDADMLYVEDRCYKVGMISGAHAVE